MVKLVTFGVPRVGDRTWSRALTHALGEPFFDQRFAYDTNAIAVSDPHVLERLADPEHPAAYRVLVPTDPITSSVIPGTFHVGRTVYLSRPKESMPADGLDHEPMERRRLMLEASRDPERIPAEAWRYSELATPAPDLEPSEAGTRAGYEKLAQAVRAYFMERGAWFDQAAFDQGVEVFLQLYDAFRQADAGPAADPG